jgi:hypothetical protein
MDSKNNPQGTNKNDERLEGVRQALRLYIEQESSDDFEFSGLRLQEQGKDRR